MKSNAARKIFRANINTLLSWVVASHVFNTFLTDNLNVAVGPFRRFASSKTSLNAVEVFFSANKQITFSPTVPTFAARISGVLAEVQGGSDERSNW